MFVRLIGHSSDGKRSSCSADRNHMDTKYVLMVRGNVSIYAKERER